MIRLKKQLLALSEAEMSKKLEMLKKELHEARAQLVVGKSNKPHVLKQLRYQIALLTSRLSNTKAKAKD